eukprot:809725_1
MLYRLGLTAVVFTSLVSVGIGGLSDEAVAKAREEAVTNAIAAIVKQMFKSDKDRNGFLSRGEGIGLARALIKKGSDSKGVAVVSHKEFLDWLGHIIDFEQYDVPKTKDSLLLAAKRKVLRDVGDSVTNFLLGPEGIKDTQIRQQHRFIRCTWRWSFKPRTELVVYRTLIEK